MVSSLCGFAQNPTDISLELQVYPTGIIPGISIDKYIGSRSSLYGRIGFNFFDHRDLGEQEMEEGSGYGLSLGYKFFFREGYSGWRFGIKNDIWRNRVNWTTDQISGKTDILVLQPSAELSYVWVRNRLVIAPSIAFGLEWNVDTDGEPTGEGPIALIGIQLGRRF